MELSNGAYTVIVANDDEDGDRVLGLARRWYEDGLLSEFAWVTPGDVSVSRHGPAAVQASVLGRDDKLDLMALLGARPRTLIRIVVLHLLTHENSNAHRLVEACDQISDLVSRAMPRQIGDGGGQAGMRLLRMNLLVPESDLFPQDVNLIEPGWEINAVVAPEDRPDLDRMSIFVRRDVNLHGHGLAAAASVGALWKGARVGAFDSHETDSTTGGREIVVLRCQARIVVGDDRSSDLAEQVVDAVQSSEMAAVPFVPWGMQAESPPAVVDAAISRLRETWWAPAARSLEPLEKAQVGLGRLISAWAVFQFRLPLMILKFLLGKGRSAVEQSLTAATVGREAGQVGRLRPLSPSQAREVAEHRMKQLSEQLEPKRLHDESSSWSSALPQAWRELRMLAIGLVDGSRLPDGFTRKQRDGLDEILAPHAVVPAPADVLRLPGRTPVGGLDVAGAEQLAAEVTQTVETDEDAVAAVPGSEASDAESAATEEERLSGWLEKRQHCLLWALAAYAHKVRHEEARRAEATHRALSNTQAPSTAKLEIAQRLVIVAWLVTFLAGAFVALMAWGVGREDPLGFLSRLPELNWPNIAKIALAVVIVLLIAGTYYFQALRAYEWDRDQRMHALKTASDEYVLSRQQERRWAHMIKGLDDWGAILAELLHRPWSSAPSTEPPAGDYADLPAAVAVARPADSSTFADPRVVAKGVEAACQRGWLAEEFDRLLTLSPQNDPRVHSQAGDLPADRDPGIRAHGPRAELVDVASAAASKENAKQHLVHELATLVTEGDVTMPPQSVIRLSETFDDVPVVDRDFLTASLDVEAPFAPELFHPDALVARLNHPERSVYNLPVGSPAPRRESVEVHFSGVSTAVRVDISPLMNTRDVRLFARVQREETPVLQPIDEFN